MFIWAGLNGPVIAFSPVMLSYSTLLQTGNTFFNFFGGGVESNLSLD